MYLMSQMMRLWAPLVPAHSAKGASFDAASPLDAVAACRQSVLSFPAVARNLVMQSDRTENRTRQFHVAPEPSPLPGSRDSITCHRGRT